MGVRHSFTSSATPDPQAGTSIVGPNEWNAEHIVQGSFDNRPSSPSAYDSEFDTNVFTGWTVLGSPTIHDINTTVAGHYYVKAATPSLGWVGIYKAIPFPSTVIIKVTDFSSYFSYNKSGIILLPSTADKVESLYMGYDNTRRFAGSSYTGLVGSPTDFLNVSGYYQSPFYIKITFTNSTTYSVWGSWGGVIWNPFVTNRTASFTVAYAGLGVRDEGIINPVEAAFDFFRVTQP